MNEIKDQIKLTAPSKTFLLGEYAVLTHGQALLLATPPYFALSKDQGIAYQDLALESHAGKLYQANKKNLTTLYFQDPHQGQGGFGASGAQFVLLARYLGISDPWQIWQNYQVIIKDDGDKGSGADILAQCSKDLVFIDIKQQKIISINWPFPDWRIVLLRTHYKLATHEHLRNLSLATKDCIPLANLITETYQALLSQSADLFLFKIKSYAKILADLGLVATHSQTMLTQLNSYPEVLAAKGCGAMGADVVLAIVPQNQLAIFLNRLTDQNLILFPETSYV